MYWTSGCDKDPWLQPSTCHRVGAYEPPDASPTIELPSATHFTASDGSDVFVTAGVYRVEGVAGTNLRLWSDAPLGTYEIFGISFTHQEPLTTPLAFAVREERQMDTVHLLLLLPGGMGIDAAGHGAGVQTRGTDALQTLSAVTYLNANAANDDLKAAADKQRQFVMKKHALRSASGKLEGMKSTPFDAQLPSMSLERCDICKVLRQKNP
jgi:hypothetical protein